MHNSIHSKFILTPILTILDDAVLACSSLGRGIETQPLQEYILQTIFLKMTGASEQKLKCICWEMATYDFTYRYELLKNSVGECSNYDEKKKVFKNIHDVIKRLNQESSLPQELVDIPVSDLNSIYSELEEKIEKSLLTQWNEQAWSYFRKNNFLIRKTKKGKKCFDHDLFKKYYEEVVYRHRNRCAHNLKSYQGNLPSLNTLAQENYELENYYNMFFVLCVLDKVFISLFTKYLEEINKSV